MSDKLQDGRNAVDQIDREIVKLLAERMSAVGKIAGWKADNPDAPLLDTERERQVADTWGKAASELGLSTYFAGRVLREVLTWSRRDQERRLDRPESELPQSIRISFQGTPGSYSDLAIRKLFEARHGGPVTRHGYRTFRAATDAVEAGEANYALLPIENTIAGSINEVYALLGDRPLHVVDEEIWGVEHVLCAPPGVSLEQIRVIRSQAVALQQCRRFLDGLVGVRVESTFDTAAAARSLIDDATSDAGAICSEDAARELGLDVVHREVADQPRNFTRFLLVGRELETPDPRLPARTSLVLTVNHCRGALAGCVNAFAQRDVNLSKLESRPLPDAPWEYLFYVDVDGHREDARVREALDAIKPLTNRLRILGCYPRRAGEPEQIPAAELPAAAVPVLPPAASACPAVPTDDRLRRVGTREDGTRTTVRVGSTSFGPGQFTMILGPCAVESRGQIMKTAAMVKERGAAMLRGGAFKPRTSPYAFQGLGHDGVDLLVEAGQAYELPVVTEIVRPEDVDVVARKADMLQVGARNMQNFGLLTRLGQTDRPVLLKRGMSATVEELLLAAEYIMAGGNHRVVLCERGIRTFETATRNTLDVSAIPVLKERTHLPVIVDPSHAAGKRSLVMPLALAAVAAGADGLIVECHPNPDEALCDKEQALAPADLDRLMAGIAAILATRGNGAHRAPESESAS